MVVFPPFQKVFSWEGYHAAPLDTLPGILPGAAELSWKKRPDEELLEKTISILKEDCVRNALTFEEWKEFFTVMGLKDIKTAEIKMWSISHIMREPILNRTKIIFRILANSRIRTRVMSISNHFKSNPEYFGFGIYVGRK